MLCLKGPKLGFIQADGFSTGYDVILVTTLRHIADVWVVGGIESYLSMAEVASDR